MGKIPPIKNPRGLQPGDKVIVDDVANTYHGKEQLEEKGEGDGQV